MRDSGEDGRGGVGSSWMVNALALWLTVQGKIEQGGDVIGMGMAWGTRAGAGQPAGEGALWVGTHSPAPTARARECV
jgi:hypothetical protein